MIPDPSSPTHTHQWKYNGVVNAMFCRCGDRIDCDYRLPDALADDRARLAQLEQEQATLQVEFSALQVELDTLKDAIAPYRHTPEDCDLWLEPYDFIRQVRDMREVGELNTRLRNKNERLDAALGETRQALQQLQETYDALLSRVAQTGVPREDSVPRPPVGDPLTDR